MHTNFLTANSTPFRAILLVPLAVALIAEPTAKVLFSADLAACSFGFPWVGFQMLRVCWEKLKIFNSIIGSVLVLVMDHFFTGQKSADAKFHFKAVLLNHSSRVCLGMGWHLHKDVTGRMDYSVSGFKKFTLAHLANVTV
jgi:hypothetical protein